MEGVFPRTVRTAVTLWTVHLSAWDYLKKCLTASAAQVKVAWRALEGRLKCLVLELQDFGAQFLLGRSRGGKT